MRNLFGISAFNPFFITKLIRNNEPTRALIYACFRSDKQALLKLWLIIAIWNCIYTSIPRLICKQRTKQNLLLTTELKLKRWNSDGMVRQTWDKLAHFALCTSHELKRMWSLCVLALISSVNQPSSEVVAAVMRHTLQEEKARHPEINEAFHRSDCAGSYASGGLLVPIRHIVISPSNAMISQSHKQAKDRMTGAPPIRNPMLTGFVTKEMM